MGLAIKRPEKAAVGPENGLPEPSVDLGAVRPGGAGTVDPPRRKFSDS